MYGFNCNLLIQEFYIISNEKRTSVAQEKHFFFSLDTKCHGAESLGMNITRQQPNQTNLEVPGG